MKTKFERQVIMIIAAMVCIMMFWVSSEKIYAAGTVSVTADKSSVQLSDTVSVSVKTSEPEDPSTPPQLTITYDSDLLTFQSCDVEYGGGEGGLLTITGTSANITFTAAKTGAAKVSAEAIIDDDGNNPATGEASVTVGASDNADLSSDATLRALSVNPGSIEPAFSPNVTDYTITIDNSVTDITVSGGVTDANAQITAASGFKNLKAGDNQAVITITAANGATLTYNFKIIRGEATQTEKPEETPKPEENVTDKQTPQSSDGMTAASDNGGYTISPTFDNSLLPDGFTKISFSYKGQSVDAASFEAGAITLLYGVSQEKGAGKFFIYDEGSDSLQSFVQIKGSENHFIIPIASKDKLPNGFKEEQLQWDDIYVPAGMLKDKNVKNASSFYLLYAVNNEGNSDYYLYDVQEGTYQRYLEHGSSDSGILSSLGKKDTIIVGALVILLVCSLMAIVNLILRNRELADDMEDNDEELIPKKTQRKKAPKKTQKSVEKKTKYKPLQDDEQLAYELGLENDLEYDSETNTKVEQKPKAKKVVTPEQAQAAPVSQNKTTTVKKTVQPKQTVQNSQNAKPSMTKQPVQSKATNPVLSKSTGQVVPPSKTAVKPKAAVQPQVARTSQQAQIKKEVTPNGITYTTGQIPITVVQPAKAKTTSKAQVPIYTLERKPVSLTREAAPDELDDDFEFEFINIDNE